MQEPADGRVDATAAAAAVEEQGGATEEISRNVTQAAAGTQKVSAAIDDVTGVAAGTGASAADVLATAGQIEEMGREVTAFLAEVRAS